MAETFLCVCAQYIGNQQNTMNSTLGECPTREANYKITDDLKSSTSFRAFPGAPEHSGMYNTDHARTSTASLNFELTVTTAAKYLVELGEEGLHRRQGTQYEEASNRIAM